MTIITALDKYAPERVTKIKSGKLREPWLTKGLINFQNKQHKMYKAKLNLNTNTVTTNSDHKYKQYRSVLQKNSQM